MEEQELRIRLAEAMGQALQASLLLTGLLGRLQVRGLPPQADIHMITDSALLMLEKHRAVLGDPQSLDVMAVDAARSRLEGLLAAGSTRRRSARSAAPPAPPAQPESPG